MGNVMFSLRVPVERPRNYREPKLARKKRKSTFDLKKKNCLIRSGLLCRFVTSFTSVYIDRRLVERAASREPPKSRPRSVRTNTIPTGFQLAPNQEKRGNRGTTPDVIVFLLPCHNENRLHFTLKRRWRRTNNCTLYHVIVGKATWRTLMRKWRSLCARFVRNTNLNCKFSLC